MSKEHSCLDSRCHNDCGFHCERIRLRMTCPECGYPDSESRYPLDLKIPHTDCFNKDK